MRHVLHCFRLQVSPTRFVNSGISAMPLFCASFGMPNIGVDLQVAYSIYHRHPFRTDVVISAACCSSENSCRDRHWYKMPAALRYWPYSDVGRVGVDWAGTRESATATFFAAVWLLQILPEQRIRSGRLAAGFTFPQAISTVPLTAEGNGRVIRGAMKRV